MVQGSVLVKGSTGQGGTLHCSRKLCLSGQGGTEQRTSKGRYRVGWYRVALGHCTVGSKKLCLSG